MDKDNIDRLALAFALGFTVFVRTPDGSGYERLHPEITNRADEPGPVCYLTDTHGEFIALEAIDIDQLLVVESFRKNWFTKIHTWQYNKAWKPETA